MSTRITNCDVQFVEEVNGLVRASITHKFGYIVDVSNKLDIDRDVCLYTLEKCFPLVLESTKLANVLVMLLLEYCAIWEEENKPPYPYFLDDVPPAVHEELVNSTRTRITGLVYNQDPRQLALKHVLTLEIAAKQNGTVPPKVLVLIEPSLGLHLWMDLFNLSKQYHQWLDRDLFKDDRTRWEFVGNEWRSEGANKQVFDLILCDDGDFSRPFYAPFLKCLQEAKRVITFDAVTWCHIGHISLAPLVSPILQSGENDITMISVSPQYMEVRKRNVFPV